MVHANKNTIRSVGELNNAVKLEFQFHILFYTFTNVFALLTYFSTLFTSLT